MPSDRLPRITFKTKPECTTWEDLEAMWREAETIEAFDGGWLYDHFYPLYGDPEGPCFEGWTALSYLAGITRRLRLGLMVSAVPYRNPGLLAKMVTTFDHFSRGRLDLGLGAGWYETEAEAFGMPLLPMGQRLTKFEEGCEALTLMLENPTATFEGKHWQLREARCEPRPVQSPRPPILMGGTGEKRFLKIAARFADDWNYPGGTPDDFAHKLKVLHGHCADVGRDPAAITPSCHVFVSDDPEQTATMAAEYVAAGSRHVCLYFQNNGNRELLRVTADTVVARLKQA